MLYDQDIVNKNINVTYMQYSKEHHLAETN